MKHYACDNCCPLPAQRTSPSKHCASCNLSQRRRRKQYRCLESERKSGNEIGACDESGMSCVCDVWKMGQRARRPWLRHRESQTFCRGSRCEVVELVELPATKVEIRLSVRPTVQRPYMRQAAPSRKLAAPVQTAVQNQVNNFLVDSMKLPAFLALVFSPILPAAARGWRTGCKLQDAGEGCAGS